MHGGYGDIGYGTVSGVGVRTGETMKTASDGKKYIMKSM